MSSHSKKLIAVFGATGHQGGAVVRALQAQGQFKVRALTRHPAKHRGLGDELVEADLDRPTTLKAALEGAHGVFLVTNVWEPGTDEFKQGTAAVRAAKAAGVQHFVDQVRRVGPSESPGPREGLIALLLRPIHHEGDRFSLHVREEPAMQGSTTDRTSTGYVAIHKRAAQNVAAIDGAVRASVKHIVFMSTAGARQEAGPRKWRTSLCSWPPMTVRTSPESIS